MYREAGRRYPPGVEGIREHELVSAIVETARFTETQMVKVSQISYNDIKEFFIYQEFNEDGGAYMNLAKVSSNGQITVPVEIRRKLNIKEGDKIIFLEKSSGEIVLQNSSVFAIRQAQSKMKDVDRSEEDVLDDVMDVRNGKRK